MEQKVACCIECRYFIVDPEWDDEHGVCSKRLDIRDWNDAVCEEFARKQYAEG